MRPIRALAAFALAAGARAQGSLGGSQGSCTSAQAWAYRGCYGDVSNGNNAGFTFKLIGSASPSDPHYYPGYTTGQVSIDICLQGCRGHGFRFAALHGGTDCYCGTIKPTTQTLGSSTTNNNTLNECHVTSLLSGGCQGNKQEWCGSSVASDVYEDTSFPTVALTAQGGNYAYVGCFTVTSPGDLVYATTAANTAACQSACANLGYPFAGMSDKGGVTNACQCGTEIQQGSPASTGQSCQACGAGDNGVSCGGLASGTPLLTVYRNTNLQGCYSPKVPSSSQTVTSTSQTVTSSSQTATSSSATSMAPVSTSTTSVVARDTSPRADGRCGLAFGGATCDPAGAYGGCCSAGGYCGTTDAHCLVSNGCQSGCTVTSSTAPRADGRCGSSFGGATCDPNGAFGGCCSSGGYCGSTTAHCLTSNGCQSGCTATSSTAPRADGRCGSSFGGATCDPNGAYGGCCSSGGYCGSTPAHCLVTNGCQNGCAIGVPTTTTTTTTPTPTTTTTTTTTSSTSSSSSTSSIVVGGSAPRADGRCGSSFGGATCDPNGAYGGCCSAGGYCGTTTAHCLVSNGCQSGCTAVSSTAPRADGRCGVSYGGATCDPNGAYGGCCSSGGYCGSTDAHCLVVNGCQNGCSNVFQTTTTPTPSTTTTTTPRLTTTTTTTTTSSSSTSSSSTSSALLGGASPRPDGQCGSAFGGATCDPNGPYGGCCSQYGYCGSTPGHCLVANGCQNGCTDGLPVTTTTTTTTTPLPLPLPPTTTTTTTTTPLPLPLPQTTTTTTTPSASTTTTPSSASRSLTSSASSGGSAPPRADGQCGSAFGGATCDPNGAYGGCCSQYGYCGSSPGHCLVANGCQNGCTDGSPLINSITTTTTGSGSPSSGLVIPTTSITTIITTSSTSRSSSTTSTASVGGSAPPRADGQCGSAFGGATCDPNGAYGGCCSQYGYCGSSPGHCLVVNGCQNGCTDGLSVITVPTSSTTGSVSLSSSSSITLIITTTTTTSSTSSSTPSPTTTTTTTTTSSSILSLRPDTTISTTTTISSSSSSFSASASGSSGARADGRCGSDFNGATCDPNGAYGGCCSQYGYCGSSPGHCLVVNGCQNGCTDGLSVITVPTSSTTGSVSLSSSSSITLIITTTTTTSSTSSSTPSPTTTTTTTTTSSSILSLRPDITIIATTTTSSSTSSSLTLSTSGSSASRDITTTTPITSSSSLSTASTAPRLDGRCGFDYGGGDFGGATCDPNGPYGGCCSQYGYCGSSDGHCLKANGCQNGCLDGPDSPSPSPTLPTTVSTSGTLTGPSSSTSLHAISLTSISSSLTLTQSTSITSSSTSSSSTIKPTAITTGYSTTSSSTSSTATIVASTAPRADGRCGYDYGGGDFGGATCDPSGPYGGCCSQYGFCGSSDAHCLKINGCQNGCSDGPDSPSPFPTTLNAVSTTSKSLVLTTVSGSSFTTTPRSSGGSAATTTTDASGDASMISGDIGPHSTHTITRTTTKDGTTFTYTQLGTATQTTSVNQTITATSIIVETMTVTQTATQNQTVTREPTTTYYPDGPTMPPSIIQNVDGYRYTGCYGELGRDPKNTLSDDFYVISGMTLEVCSEYCSEYEYFGLEGGTHCYCGGIINAGAEMIDAAWCDAPCTGNRTEICGGYQALDIYERIPGGLSISASGTSSTSNPTSTVSEPTGTSTTASSTAASSTAASSTAASSTAASSTAASSTAASSTAASSATPTSTTSVCYDGSTNGSIITTPNNHQYGRECATYYYGSEQRVEMTVLSLESCAQQCDVYNYNPNEQNGSCVGVLFYPERDSGQCWLKFSIGASLPSADLGDGGPVDAALLVVKASSSTTTAASSTTSTASSTGTTACVNGSIFTVPDGRRFQTLCHLDWNSDGIYYTFTDSLETCAAQCAEYNTGVVEQPCVGVSFVPGRQGVNCYLKYGFDRPVLDWPFEVDSALLLPEEASSTSAFTPSATPSATGSPTCADGSNNGSIYVTPSGHRYERECGLYYYGSESDQGRSASFDECAQSCDSWNSDPTHQVQKCVAVLFFSKTDGSNCWFKYDLGGTIQNPNWGPVDSGLLLPDNSTLSSTTSSSMTSSSTTSSSYSSPTTFSTIGCPSAVTLTEAAATITKPAVTVTVTATTSVNCGIP